MSKIFQKPVNQWSARSFKSAHLPYLFRLESARTSVSGEHPGSLLLYPFLAASRHLPRFQSLWNSFKWDSLQLKKDKAWALHKYDRESKTVEGKERWGVGGNRENMWEYSQRERKRGESERHMNAKKKGNEEGGRQMQRREEEGAIAERCELNELWAAAAFSYIHSPLVITAMIKGCVASFPSSCPSATCCRSLLSSPCYLAICEISLTPPPPEEGMRAFIIKGRCEAYEVSACFSFTFLLRLVDENRRENRLKAKQKATLFVR